jgi:dTDP-4-dehydrorhamnose 3,5-epimerase-like enzyme
MVMPKASWIELGCITDDSGKLQILELPLNFNRLYYIKGVPSQAERGFHAHKTLHQVFLVPQGNLELELITPRKSEIFSLSASEPRALYVPPGYWRVISQFSPDAICFVMATDHYDETDYIRNFKDYITWFEKVFKDES